MKRKIPTTPKDHNLSTLSDIKNLCAVSYQHYLVCAITRQGSLLIASDDGLSSLSLAQSVLIQAQAAMTTAMLAEREKERKS